MKLFTRTCYLVALLAAFFLSGCKDSELESGSNVEQPKSATAFFDEDGAAVQVLNARSNDKWVYFDLETFSVVFPQDPENDTQWDVAFQRFKVKTNSGVSGSGAVEVAAVQDTDFLSVTATDGTEFFVDRALSDLPDEELIQLGDNIFFSVCESGFDDEEAANYCLANGQVDREHLNPNESAYVFLTKGSGHVMTQASTAENRIDDDPILGWYDYFLHENHLLRPTPDVWVVRSTDGVEFALEMLGYYGYNEGDAESGTVAIRYLSLSPDFTIPPPGDQQLSVDVAADKVSGIAPLAVAFKGNAEGVVGTALWAWDFGDGATSKSQNPEHVYTVPGNYTAVLTVTDDRAIPTTNSIFITAAEAGTLPPTVNAGNDQNITLAAGEAGTTVTLDGSLSDDADGAIVSYVWTGSSNTGAPNPEDVIKPVVQLAAGGHTFTLTVTDDNGNKASDTVHITVNPDGNQLPVAVATSDIDIGAGPLSVSLVGDASSDADGTIVNWHWDFGDGATSDGVANITHLFSPGVHNVVLTVTDDKGVTNTDSLTVRVGYLAIQDTYHYEFLGNQADATGDSGGILVWKHESNHGAKGLIQFPLTTVTSELEVGNYTATLHLYQVCEISGFVGACPGYPDSDNPFTPGTATVKIDVILQDIAWTEQDDTQVWDDVNEASAVSTTLTLSSDNGWSSTDVTLLVDEWLGGTRDFGFSLSQEAYPTIRADSGSIPVVSFCDSESSEGICATGDFRPYLVIKKVP